MYKVWYQEEEELPYLVGQYVSIKLAREGAINFGKRFTAQVHEFWMWVEDGEEVESPSELVQIKGL